MAHHLEAEARRHDQPDLIGMLAAWHNRSRMIDRLDDWQRRRARRPKPARWSDGKPAKPKLMPVDAPPLPPSDVLPVLWALALALALGGATLAAVGYADRWVPWVSAAWKGWGR